MARVMRYSPLLFSEVAIKELVVPHGRFKKWVTIILRTTSLLRRYLARGPSESGQGEQMAASDISTARNFVTAFKPVLSRKTSRTTFVRTSVPYLQRTVITSPNENHE